MRDEDGDRAREFSGPLDLPDDFGSQDDGEAASGPSLSDDIAALLEDGKTYAEAEIAYQKSRASFAADKLKGIAAYGLLAIGLLHLALIAVTIGVLFALIPLIGAWGATAVVTATLVLGAVLLLRLVRDRAEEIASAFTESKE